jgi:nicotinamidase-related amidase
MVALLVIDMQVGMFNEPKSRHDQAGVVERINALSRCVRDVGGTVVFIQHDSPTGGVFAPHTPGWQLLPTLSREDRDPVVHKTACDSFYETELESVLAGAKTRDLLVTGCATEYCVDTTVRAAASHNFAVTVVGDAHTTADRDHLDAVSIIRHHNVTWKGLLLPRSQVAVEPTSTVLEQLAKGAGA